jgi:hypothetical protein
MKIIGSRRVRLAGNVARMVEKVGRSEVLQKILKESNQ